MGRSANSFDELHHALQQPLTFVDEILIEFLEKKLNEIKNDPEILKELEDKDPKGIEIWRTVEELKTHYRNTSMMEPKAV